jgi:signal peptidase II
VGGGRWAVEEFTTRHWVSVQLPHWPVFNLADSAICCGGALMVLLTVLGLHPDGQVDRRSVATAPGPKPAAPATPASPVPGPSTKARDTP